MKKLLIVIGLLIGMAILMSGCALISAIGINNSLVQKNQEVSKAWGQVDNVLQRRFDLIPNLVQTVSGAASFEKETLIAVTEARASVGRVTVKADDVINDAHKMKAYMEAQNGLSQALSRLMVVAEKYPDLKANANFQQLQAQLEGTENRISVERGKYNDAVSEFNTAVGVFPGVMIASFRGFKERPYFKVDQGAEKAPAVKFDFGSKPTAQK
jgi:LemA protein